MGDLALLAESVVTGAQRHAMTLTIDSAMPSSWARAQRDMGETQRDMDKIVDRLGATDLEMFRPLEQLFGPAGVGLGRVTSSGSLRFECGGFSTQPESSA